MTNSPPKPELHDEDIDLFYFESDHLALKGNVEYSDLLKTIFTLEAQRKRAIDDYNEVVELQKQAEKNPLGFMEKLRNGEGIGVPDLQHVVEVPKINWAKFNLPIPESCLREINSEKKEDAARVKTEDLKHRNSSTSKWTHEEQKRLEELLIIYPPEEVELRRFRKIAAALGTRTVKQVCSRVQKYFIKLRKAGLPVPGRVPKLCEKKRTHKHQRFHYMLKPSTFFPNLDVPVVMNDDEEVPGPSQTSKSSDTIYDSHSSNYLLSGNYPDEKKIEKNENELDLQIHILKSVRREKQKENESTGSLFQHVGFRCNYCKDDPIKGSRWQCMTCKSESVDFCTDCILSQMYSEDRHPLSHKFLIVRGDGSTVVPSSDSSCESDSDTANRNFEVSDFNSDEAEMDEDVKNIENIKQESSFNVSEDTDFEVQGGFVCEDDAKLNLNNKFTETQNVSYNYLHSKLFIDEP